jgi:hypothetical protein
VWNVPIPSTSVMILSIAYLCSSTQNAVHPCPVICNILLYYQNLNNVNLCRSDCKNIFQDYSNIVCVYGGDCLQACQRGWNKETWAADAASLLTFLTSSSDQSSDSEVSTTSSNITC